MPRPKPTKYNAKQEKAIRMEARGEGRPAILKEVFGVDVKTATPSEIHAADSAMTRWRRFPCYEDVWKDEVKRVCFGMAGKALRVIDHQIDNNNDWLANKAANDALAFSKPHIWGDEERNVHVQITGMPDLGSPEQENSDG